ncbi:hypothetical protein Tco_0633944 [Tanacetum coccineum]
MVTRVNGVLASGVVMIFEMDIAFYYPVIHQPIREKTCAELLAEERTANINTQSTQYSVVHQPPQETSLDFLQDNRNLINYVQTFLGKFKRFSFYETPKVISLAWETISEIKHAFEDKQYQPEGILELFHKLHDDVQNIHEELAEYINTPSWNRPTIYCDDDDDDEDYTIAITPDLPITDSLIMEDEHLDTISATESDELIKSSVEDLVQIPSESEGIPDNMCDVPFRDNSPPLDISKDQFEDFSDFNDDSTSIDDDSFSIDNIDYVEASPPHSVLVSLDEVKDFHPEDGELENDVLREKLLKINLLIAKIETLKDNPTPSSDFVIKSPSTSPNSFLEETNTSYNSLPDILLDSFVIKSHIPVEDDDSFLKKSETTPELETFKFDIKEKNSGSTTIYADISLPDLKCFYFKSEPDPGDLTSIIDPEIRENVSSTTNVNLPFQIDQSHLFAYVVWIFLSFLPYPVAPPYLISSGNEDTIFDPGISIYHSFMTGVSHRSGTFMKFNVYPNHLNESLSPEIAQILKTRARSFVLRSLDLHIFSFILGIQYPNLID